MCRYAPPPTAIPTEQLRAAQAEREEREERDAREVLPLADESPRPLEAVPQAAR